MKELINLIMNIVEKKNHDVRYCNEKVWHFWQPDRNVRLNSQRHSNFLVDGLRMQVKWLTFRTNLNSFTKYNSLRLLVHWYNLRRMNNYIISKIDSRFMDLQHERIGLSKVTNHFRLDFDYLLVRKQRQKHTKKNNTFKTFTMSQIKLFLFFGHDTISSTICYIFYIFATNSAVLARVRAEHDSVIGSDILKTAFIIISDPSLLNRLLYTLAVLKKW